MTFDANIKLSTLDNGLRIVSESMPGARSTAVGAWVAVGSRDEAPELSGASHFLEHLLFKGTAQRSAREVAEAFDGVGGEMNAFTAREYTAFYARVPASVREMAIETLFDVVRAPSLRPYDVDAERQVIAEELVAAFDTPDDVVHIALYDALFPDHALGREVLGDFDTIGSLTDVEIKDFHKRWYSPSNIVISASGDVDHEALVGSADEQFGMLEPLSRPNREAPSNSFSPRAKTELKVEQVHIALGWRALEHGDSRRYALAVANQILGGSPSSRLFQNIREDKALAYTVFSSTSGYSDAGSATVYAATSTDRAPDLLEGLDESMAEFVSNGVSQRELDMARTGFEGSLIMGLEDSGSRMSRLATNVALHGKVIPIEEFLGNLSDVTVEDVNGAIQDVFGVDPVVSLVGSDLSKL